MRSAKRSTLHEIAPTGSFCKPDDASKSSLELLTWIEHACNHLIYAVHGLDAHVVGRYLHNLQAVAPVIKIK